ncbi:hypothetical protein PPYR_01216 [Photinus pyralis]|uniref:Core-binding (CB) domain-containing protein n=1 Tax=Photinus pyralis TaxID=7054 RepID=A0A5N4B3V2_PHOPY|nr:hypothetical protein PPYR_01216 [Photinus pyralis]
MLNDMESDHIMSSTPPEIMDVAEQSSLDLLTRQSKDAYKSSYKRFIDWRRMRNTHSFSENVLLAYLADLSVKVKPSTLWSQYSMLKATLTET